MVSFNSSQSKGLSEENYKSLQSLSSWPRPNFWASPAILWNWAEHSLCLWISQMSKLSLWPHWLVSKQDTEHGGVPASAGTVWGEPADLNGTALNLSQYGQLQTRYLIIIRGRDQSMWGLLLLSCCQSSSCWWSSNLDRGIPVVPAEENLQQYSLYSQQSCQRGRVIECGVGSQGLLRATPANPG